MSSWSEPQSAPGLVFADRIELLYLWLQNKYKRKIPLGFRKEQGKYARALCSQQGLPSGEASEPEPNWPGKGKYSSPVDSSHPVPPGREAGWSEKNWKILLKFTVQRHRLSKTLSSNHKAIEFSSKPYNTLPHYLSSIAIPLTWNIISSCHKKLWIQGISKGKKCNLKRLSKCQN